MSVSLSLGACPLKAHFRYNTPRAEDLGLIDLDAEISSYWPEFSSAEPSKNRLTAVDVLRHEGGMTCFNFGTKGGTREDIRSAFAAADLDGSGEIDINEFRRSVAAAFPVRR